MPPPPNPPPRPVAYASARMVADDTRAAAADVLLPARAGTDTALAAGWLLALLVGVVVSFDRFAADEETGVRTVGSALFDPVADAAIAIARWSAGPLSAGFAFGVFAAAALWHWPRRRLAWAAAVPAAAGLWSVFDPATHRSYAAAFPIVLLAGVTTLQAVAVLLGTRFGRPVARWLATRLLPPGMRELAAALWSGR